MPQVKIEKLVQGAYGLARQDGRAIFVRGVVPGEAVEIAVGATHKGYQDAAVVRVVEASPDRQAAPCAVYGRCGGCQLQHMRYSAQLHWKRAILAETLRRVGKLELPEIPPVTPSPQDYGSRSVVRFGVMRQGKGLALGLHQEGSATMVPVAECVVLPDAVGKVVIGLAERLADFDAPPCRIDSIELRASVSFGHVVLVVRSRAGGTRQAEALLSLGEGLPAVVGQIVLGAQHVRGARWVRGQDWIAERLDDMLVRISDRSLLQTNWPVTQALSRTVTEWVAPRQGLRVLDLYAGTGTLGLPLAKRGALVTAVEGNPASLADARRTANGSHIGRCRFRLFQIEKFLSTVALHEYDLVVADPPPAGFSREAMTELLRVQVPRVLYASCDSATLARDLSRLCGAGYRIVRIQAFDMVPQTACLETLVELCLAPR